MDRVREVCSVASAVRKADGDPGRQPLRKLTVADDGRQARCEPLTSIVAAEVNVQEVVLVDLADVDDEDAPVLAEADRQRPGRGTSAGAGCADGDQGGQERRLVGRRRRAS